MNKVVCGIEDNICRLETKIARLEKMKGLVEKEAIDRKRCQEDPNALFPVYRSDEGDSFWNHIKRPHCPSCDFRLTRWSNVVRDEVWNTVNFCPRCGQMLKWNHYNDNV